MSDLYLFLTEPISSKNQIEHNYSLLNNTMSKDPSLHFQVAVTKKWKMVNIPLQSLGLENPYINLGLIRRMSDPAAEIEIIAALTPREIDPANWLVLHLKNYNFKILQMERLDSPTGEVGDILAEIKLDSKTFVARALSIKDGDRIFAVICQVESGGYEEVAEEFFMAISKFNLLNPSGKKFAEQMKTHEIISPVNCRFLFPESWLQRDDSDPPPRGSSFSLINVKGDKWAGQFTFAAIPHEYEETYEGLLSNYLEQLDENDIEVEPGKLVSVPNVSGFKGMWSGILSAENDDEEPLEIRCAILEHPQAWFLFAVIGPDWELDPEAQSINYRAFRLSLESFSVG